MKDRPAIRAEEGAAVGRVSGALHVCGGRAPADEMHAGFTDSAMARIMLGDVIAILAAAVVSLVSTGISRSRPLLRAASIAGLLVVAVAVAIQGTAYWPGPWT